MKFYTNSFGLKIVQGVGTATYLTGGHINLAIIPIGPEREIEGNQLKVRDQSFWFRATCEQHDRRAKDTSRSNINEP